MLLPSRARLTSQCPSMATPENRGNPWFPHFWRAAHVMPILLLCLEGLAEPVAWQKDSNDFCSVHIFTHGVIPGSRHSKALGISSPATKEAHLVEPYADGGPQWSTMLDWTCRWS